MTINLSLRAFAAVCVVTALASCGGKEEVIQDTTLLGVGIVGANIDALAPGASGTMPLLISRTGGYDGRATIAAGRTVPQNGIEGISWPEFVVAPGQTTAEMPFTVAANATPGVHLAVFLVTTDRKPVGLFIGGGADFTVALPSSYSLGKQFSLDYEPYNGASVDIVIVAARNNFTGVVALTATTPAPATVSLSRTTLAGSETQSVLTVALPASATAQDRDITITGTSPGQPDQHFTVQIHSYAPVLRIAASPIDLTIQQGTSQPVTLTVTREVAPSTPIQRTATITDSANATIVITVANPSFVTVPGAVPVTTTTTAQVAVPLTLAAGTYTAAFTVSTPVSPPQTARITLHVTADGYTLAPQAPQLNMPIGTTQTENVTIARTGFAGAVSVSATTDDPHLTVTPNPVPPAFGNQVALTVDVGSAARAGTHTVALKGTSTLPIDRTASFDVVVSLPTGGTPTSLVIVPVPTPNPPTTTRGSVVQYTAYLIDAAGNRTLPASGWNIGFATGSTAVASVQSPLADYDINQRWRIASMGAGQTTGISTVTAFYFNTVTGTSTFTAGSTLTVTP